MLEVLERQGLRALVLGAPNGEDVVRIACAERVVLAEPRIALQRLWSETTWQMQTLRDHPESARQEYDRVLDTNDPGLVPVLTFDPADDVAGGLERARYGGGMAKKTDSPAPDLSGRHLPNPLQATRHFETRPLSIVFGMDGSRSSDSGEIAYSFREAA